MLQSFQRRREREREKSTTPNPSPTTTTADDTDEEDASTTADHHVLRTPTSSNHNRWYRSRTLTKAPSICCTPTKVLSGITDPELDVLDTFEDVEYERRTIEVSLMDSSQKLTAYAYVWANINDPNLYGDWHFEVMAIDMSYRLGWIDESIMKRASNILKQAKLPTAPPDTMTVEMFKSRC